MGKTPAFLAWWSHASLRRPVPRASEEGCFCCDMLGSACKLPIQASLSGFPGTARQYLFNPSMRFDTGTLPAPFLPVRGDSDFK